MPAGRPRGSTKRTPEIDARIEQALALGATYELAADYAGIAYVTFDDWRKKYPDFSALVQRANGRAAIGWLAKIEKEANEGDWRAAAWKLERRYPESYGRQVQDQHLQGQIGVTVRTEPDLSQLTVDELREVERLLLKAAQPVTPPNGSAEINGAKGSS